MERQQKYFNVIQNLFSVVPSLFQCALSKQFAFYNANSWNDSLLNQLKSIIFMSYGHIINASSFSTELPCPTLSYAYENFDSILKLILNAYVQKNKNLFITNFLQNLQSIVQNSIYQTVNDINDSEILQSNITNFNEHNMINERKESLIHNLNISSYLSTCVNSKIKKESLILNKLNSEQQTNFHKDSLVNTILQTSLPSLSLSDYNSAYKFKQNQKPNNIVNRLSYPREFKLMVVQRYLLNNKNKCKEFQITKSMLNGWIQKADKIKSSRPGSLKSGRSGRRPLFPDIERQLFILYTKQKKI